MIQPVASTLEQIAARLKEINEGAQDVSKLPVVLHSASGLSFRVGPMSRPHYDAWQNERHFEDLAWQRGGGEQNGTPKKRDKSDAFLLTHAVFSESGEKLTAELAKLLLDGPGFGPSTHILCEAAAKENPPRAQLVSEVQLMSNLNTSFIVMFRTLEKCGLLDLLIDRFAGDDADREKAIKRLAQVEDTLVFWESQYPVEEIAGIMETDIYAPVTSSE